MTAETKKNIHTVSLLVANKPGVLVRIALVFARRGYNIDSLVVSPAFNPRYSRMTVTAQGDPETLEQIIKSTNKLIDVIHVFEHTQIDAVHRELALIKVKYTAGTKSTIEKIVKRFRAHIIDDHESMFVIEQTGITEKLDELEVLLKKYHVIEMVRTGKVVMAKGHEET